MQCIDAVNKCSNHFVYLDELTGIVRGLWAGMRRREIRPGTKDKALVNSPYVEVMGEGLHPLPKSAVYGCVSKRPPG